LPPNGFLRCKQHPAHPVFFLQTTIRLLFAPVFDFLAVISNQGILSILIAVANRSHTNLKGSFHRAGLLGASGLLTPET
jgi:hypothetical protein